ncbi:MAG TPA: citryl-CoA lyase [Candidatus Dormibacteraeota bacterium]|nr:citryl-CoA lyase [Candidatus Dormibacteraeota bacterium]
MSTPRKPPRLAGRSGEAGEGTRSKRKRLRSDMGWSTTDRIVVRGHDLVEDLIGKVSLGDMAFLELKGRLPNAKESAVFNSLAVTLVEHGMTPSAIATRLTYFGAPESLQGAVAAGLLGIGDRFGGSIEEAARTLQEALADSNAGDLQALARQVVAKHKEKKRPIAGLGHPIHKPVDPRTPRLFAIAADNGFSGRYVKLMQLISQEAERSYGRELPVNATGAIGAIASELEIPWQVSRGLAVMARAIGLVGHIQEEVKEPLAAEIWSLIEEESSEHHRPE